MPMNGRLLRPRQTIHPEAADWANRVRTHGGSVSGTTLSAVDRFVKAIHAAGIRDRFYRLNLFCGNPDGELAAVRTPLFRGPSLTGTQYGNATDTNINFVAGDYLESDGLQGGASPARYLRTGVTPDAIGVATGHLSLTLKGKTLAADGSDGIGIGAQNPTHRYTVSISTANNFLGGGLTDYMTRGWWGSTANTQHTTSGSAVMAGGQYLFTRTSGTRTDIYLNGSSVANSTASVTPGSNSNDIWVMANNNNGSPQFSGGVLCRGYTIGLAMNALQAAAFFAVVAAFNASMGRTT